MKTNWRFILSVVCLILSSALLLTGCMAAIAANVDTPRPYRLSTVPEAVGTTNEGSDQRRPFVETLTDPDPTGPPVSQEELKAKFSAMYDLSQGERTISVISETFLADFWKGYDTQASRSLSVPEVLYIIQDSIRLYNGYDAVILPGLTADKDISIHAPALTEKTIIPDPNDRDRARADVRDIIHYRLQALSSPEAFFTVPEMMGYLETDLGSVPEICQTVFFYIPDHSADTDRDAYLRDKDYSESRSKYGVFCFSYFDRIVLFSKGNPETVFPTTDMSRVVQENEILYLEMRPDFLLDPDLYDMPLGVSSFILDPEARTFYITTTCAHYVSELDRVVLDEKQHDFKKWPGTYEKRGDRLYLYPFDIPDTVLVFDCDADGSMRFNEAASIQSRFFDDLSLFLPIDPDA